MINTENIEGILERAVQSAMVDIIYNANAEREFVTEKPIGEHARSDLRWQLVAVMVAEVMHWLEKYDWCTGVRTLTP